MALNYANKKLDKYFDALFVIGRMGNSEVELSALRGALSDNDYAELKKFDSLHKKLIEFVSLDENEYVLQTELALLDEYEKTADNINIAPRYKAKMYDDVLIGVDKFAPSSSRALNLLSKIVDNTSLKASADLHRWQKVADRYRYGAPVLYENLNKKISLKINGKKPADVEQAKKRFAQINEEIKSADNNEKRISLFEEQLELADKCAFRRVEKFKIKATICDKLGHLYAFTMDGCKQDYYRNECARYQKLVQNVYNHIGK